MTATHARVKPRDPSPEEQAVARRLLAETPAENAAADVDLDEHLRLVAATVCAARRRGAA